MDIVVPDSVATGPLKINNRRQVVGIHVDRGKAVHGFLWDDGQFGTIDVPRASGGTAVPAINNRGQTAGSYIDADGAYHGFLRERNGRVLTLPDAPGAGPAMGGTQPAALTDRGQIVAVAYDARRGSRAFRFERGVLTQLDGPGAVFTRALDINSRGEIVGDYGTRAPAGSAAAQKYMPPNCPPVTFSTWPCT